MLRVMVIGADGTIGCAFFQALQQRGYIVHGTTRREPGKSHGRLHIDLADPEVGTQPLPDVDIAYFAASVEGFAHCRSNPALARQVNVSGSSRLALRLTEQGARVVLLSSSAVFGFRQPRVPALTPTNPASVLGSLKAEAEAAFLGLGPKGSILRLTKVLTPDAPLFSHWIAALFRGQPISAFSDLHIAPIALEDATSAMFGVAEDTGGGIYQVSGADDISYAQAARHLARRMGVKEDLVREELALERGIPAAEIPRFTSLDTSRLEAITGRAAPAPYDVLDKVYGPVIDAMSTAKHRSRN